MAKADTSFFIGGIRIKTPSAFTIERYPVTEGNRTANGNMKLKLINKKRKFIFEYEVLSGTELEHIRNILWNSKKITSSVNVPFNGKRETANVYYGQFAEPVLKVKGDDWLYGPFTFNLIEL